MTQCTGECCRRFVLYILPGRPATLAEVQAAQHHPDNAPFIKLLRRINQSPYFRCVAWDRKTKLCTIYEQRPKLCRDFPYDRTCQHCGMVAAGREEC